MFLLFEECMAGDVNLFLNDSQQDIAEIEIMIAGKKFKLQQSMKINKV